MSRITEEDINYLAQQSPEKLSLILSGMTALMSDTENKFRAIEGQAWYQRMVNTVFGKNKITQQEIQQNHDKLNAYMSEAIAELYNRKCIDQRIFMSLGMQLNELYANQIQLKQMLGAFVGKLNEKIESVDNFHILTTEIEQGVYNCYPSLIAICKILSLFDNRVLNDERKLDIITRSLLKQEILNDEEIALIDYLQYIIEIPMEDVGQIYLELSNIRGNYIADIFIKVIENYHFLPDLMRKMKKKLSIINSCIESEDLDGSIELSIHDIYNDFVNSLIDANNNLLSEENQIENDVSTNDDITEEEQISNEEDEAEKLFKSGMDYYLGREVKRDYFKAKELFIEASEGGYAKAAFAISIMYKNGYGVAENEKQELKWMKKAADLGDTTAKVLVALQLLDEDEEDEEAMQYIESACDDGNLLAMFMYAGLIIQELEDEIDDGEIDITETDGWKLVLRAAENGQIAAQMFLAEMFEEGDLVQENEEEAFKWYLSAAEQGSSEAQSQVAECYYYGNGVDEDEEKAKYWLRKAAIHGEGTSELQEWFGEDVDDFDPKYGDFFDDDDDVMSLIENACKSFISSHEEWRYNATDAIKDNFNYIDNVYLVHDDTEFQIGTLGFAITDRGLYCMEKKCECDMLAEMLAEEDILGNPAKMSYEELANVKKIYVEGNCIYADHKPIAYITGVSKEEMHDLVKLYEKIVSIVRKHMD